MRKSYRGSARSYDLEDHHGLTALVQNLYFEAYIQLGEVPIALLIPKDILDRVQSRWMVGCLLPGGMPKVAESDEQEIGILVAVGDEIFYPVRAKGFLPQIAEGPLAGRSSHIVVYDTNNESDDDDYEYLESD